MNEYKTAAWRIDYRPFYVGRKYSRLVESSREQQNFQIK